MNFAMNILDNLEAQVNQHVERAIRQMRQLTLRRGPRAATVQRGWDRIYDKVLGALEDIADSCETDLALAILEEEADGGPPPPLQQPGSLFMFNDNVRGVNHDLKAGHPKVSRGSTLGQPRVKFL